VPCENAIHLCHTAHEHPLWGTCNRPLCRRWSTSKSNALWTGGLCHWIYAGRAHRTRETVWIQVAWITLSNGVVYFRISTVNEGGQHLIYSRSGICIQHGV